MHFLILWVLLLILPASDFPDDIKLGDLKGLSVGTFIFFVHCKLLVSNNQGGIYYYGYEDREYDFLPWYFVGSLGWLALVVKTKGLIFEEGSWKRRCFVLANGVFTASALAVDPEDFVAFAIALFCFVVLPVFSCGVVYTGFLQRQFLKRMPCFEAIKRMELDAQEMTRTMKKPIRLK